MAGAKVRGITIELSADATGINDALRKVSSSIAATGRELRDIDKLLKLDPTNTVLLAQKHETLQRQIANTKDKLETLKKAEEDLKRQMENGGTEEQQRQLAALQREIVSCEKDLDKYTDQLEETERETRDVSSETKNMAKSEETAAQATEKVSQGFTVMKGALANLAAQGIQKAASALKDFAGDMINTAAEVKAANSQYEQTFGDLQGQATAVIDTIADKTGILATRLRGSASAVYAFARSSGADTSEAMALMEEALMAAADSAAYYDRSLEDSTETLQSFLKGNYANDAALGVSATEFTRNAKATELFGMKFAELTEIQKQQTLLKMVTDAQKLSGAMGQAAREADGWENVQGNLNETWKQFKANVGTPFLEALIPVVQNVTKKFQEWQKSVDWKKYGNDVKSALDKVTDGLGWIVKHGNELKAITVGFVTALAANKIGQFASQAVSLAKALDTAKVAQEGMNAAANANPYVLMASVLIGLTTALISNAKALAEQAKEADASWQQTQRLIDQADEQIAAVNDSVEAYNRLDEARTKSISAGMAEINHVQSLTNELKGLADENGQVDAANQARASFILGELNNALGTEYSMNGNIIGQYQQLVSSVGGLIEAKKAEIILRAEEEAYREAILNKDAAEMQLIATEEARNALNQELAAKVAELTELEKWYGLGMEDEGEKIRMLKDEIAGLEGKHDDLNASYQEQAEVVNKYAYDIEQYEANMEASHNGHMDAIEHKSWEVAKASGDASTAASDAVIAKAWETKTQWLGTLGQQLSETTGKQVEFRDAGNGMVQAYVNGQKAGAPMTLDQAQAMGSAIKMYLNTLAGPMSAAGTQIPQGVANGIYSNSGAAYAAVSNLANGLINQFMADMKIQSPSKVFSWGAKMDIEGFVVGIDKNEKMALKSIDQMGQDILQEWDASMTGLKMPPVNANKQYAGLIASGMKTGTGGTAAQVGNIESILNKWLPQLANTTIELDGRTLVGGLVSDINRALGGVRIQNERGIG